MAEKKYSVGQHVFIISNNSYVMEMQIMNYDGTITVNGLWG